jgi:hypothetical protein
MQARRITTTSGGGDYRVEVETGDKLLHFHISGAVELGDVNSAIITTLVHPSSYLCSDIEFPEDHPVSARLLGNLHKLQEIREQWYPQSKRVAIRARSDVVTRGNENVGLLFSGGVDAMYSFLLNEEQITDLIFCIGLDIKPDEVERARTAVAMGRRFAASRGKRFVTIDTNAGKAWDRIPFSPQHGQFYAAMAVMLGCRTGIVAASYSYKGLRAWGSHPLTDELIATEWTTTVHHGLVERHIKLQRVAEDAECLAMLRVCNASAEYNCGKCEKCLRTMLPLQLLGKSSPTLPGTVTPEDIRGIKLYADAKAEFWIDNLVMAQEAGDRKMVDAIRSILLDYHRRKAVKNFIEALKGRV